MEKRKEAGKAEIERLKQAKELQKKMGRALVRSVVEPKDESSKPPSESQSSDTVPSSQKPKSGKSVSFADNIEESKSSSEKGKAVNWGDVAPGRLRPTQGTTPQLKSRLDTQTMKMQVVERIPGAPAKPPTPEPVQLVDSDDESIPDENVDDSVEDEDFSGDDDHEPIEWEEDDLDFARHQREVALAYYEKRAAMVGEATAAMKAHSHDGDHEWDQPVNHIDFIYCVFTFIHNYQQDVPLDATLASSPPKPPVSKFKSSLVSRAATTTMASHSLGQAILPVSQTSSLKSAIRMGKLEDDKLIGGSAGESDDDMDEDVKQIIELLKKGEVTNIGPKPSASSSKPQVETQTSKPASKVSRFKAAMSSDSTSTTLTSPDSSGLTTPISVAERSSPKSATPQEHQLKANPIVVPTSTSRPPTKLQFQPSRPSTSRNIASRPSASSSSANQNTNSKTTASLTPESFHPVSNPFSNIIDSPSFLPAGIIESPAFQSMIIDPTQSNSATPPKSQPIAHRVTERPAVVMTNEVKESQPINRETVKPEKKQRISRFMAERM